MSTSTALQMDDSALAPDGSARPSEQPVRILMLAFLFMFQGYGVMNGNPQHVLKQKLDISSDQAGAFQDATASFQLAKLWMRVAQIAFLVVLPPRGIVYLAYVVMFFAVAVPVLLVWGAGITELWVVYLQYSLGGIAVGLFEGTFLSVVSPLGKNTKTFVIMGAPLGFAVHNIPLGLFQQWGMPTVTYYLLTLCCLPVAVVIFHRYAPQSAADGEGKGCQVFYRSLRSPGEWLPGMVPWLVAKFCGNFVLEDAFPLLFNTFNTDRVPLFGGPASTSGTVPTAYYLSLFWFVMMALGDTLGRRVPQYVSLGTWRARATWITAALILCIVGQALNFLLQAIVAGIAVFIATFGNGFVYGLSAKYIDTFVPARHRYAAYNLWCFCGDLGGYAGQSCVSVRIAADVCHGHHYTYVCHKDKKVALRAVALGIRKRSVASPDQLVF